MSMKLISITDDEFIFLDPTEKAYHYAPRRWHRTRVIHTYVHKTHNYSALFISPSLSKSLSRSLFLSLFLALSFSFSLPPSPFPHLSLPLSPPSLSPSLSLSYSHMHKHMYTIHVVDASLHDGRCLIAVLAFHSLYLTLQNTTLAASTLHSVCI